MAARHNTGSDQLSDPSPLSTYAPSGRTQRMLTLDLVFAEIGAQ